MRVEVDDVLAQRSRLVRKGSRVTVATGHIVLACVDSQRRPMRVPAEIADNVELCDGPPWAAGVA